MHNKSDDPALGRSLTPTGRVSSTDPEIQNLPGTLAAAMERHAARYGMASLTSRKTMDPKPLKLVIGRRYMVRNGTQTQIRGAQYADPGEGEFEYYAAFAGDQTITYRDDGTVMQITGSDGTIIKPVGLNNDLDIIGEVAE